MDITEALLDRRSIRDFTPRPVDHDLILKIIETAARAPSSGNYQPWEVFVATGDALERIRQGRLQRLAENNMAQPEVDVSHWPNDPQPMVARMQEMYAARWQLRGLDPTDAQLNRRANARRTANVFGAPALVVLCMHRDINPFTVFDLGLFAQSIVLAGRSLGVDSLIAAGLAGQPDVTRKELAIPDELQIVIGIALGHADPDSAENTYRSPRRPVGEFVTIRDR